ncbi:dienelactone hydrolase family protein [Modestobacter roseus]|uniref:Dienelactone hydrolase n=1 Tax=Modestobacter roseus TaxID=1181884 RepID=A0A562IWX8_9ACTN|nr:dienelactone hydrolase family protein [Modestobacter roseus]MQA34731.1 dienelactone hydrolase [Modestobacter roseus]TWH75105.1 dienelactone hydrolase [Modestobacter roseus]
MTESSSLAGWTSEDFTDAGITHQLFTRGSGPGVVLLPEIPGMTPEVMGLADHLVESGFTVTVISLFGDPGRPLSPGYALASTARACITREFRALATRADRPVAGYVRAVARRLHDRTGGPGVGVIGMCFSGGFALAAAVEPVVLAPVASQPAVPFGVTPGRRGDLGMSDEERDTVAERVRSEGLCLLGLRFSEDRLSPPDRFRSLRAAFGDGWLPIVISSRAGNPAGIGTGAHSVLTHPDADTPGHPTHDARAEVVAFLRDRLTGAGTAVHTGGALRNAPLDPPGQERAIG